MNKFKTQLRTCLSEYLTFPELLEESKKFQERATNLMKQYLDANYSKGYKLSVDILRCLTTTRREGNLKQNWGQLLKEFLLTQTDNMHEVFAECFVKSGLFVDYGAIEPMESAVSLADDQDNIDEQPNQVEILRSLQPCLFDLIEQDIERVCQNHS